MNEELRELTKEYLEQLETIDLCIGQVTDILLQETTIAKKYSIIYNGRNRERKQQRLKETPEQVKCACEELRSRDRRTEDFQQRIAVSL